MGSSHGYPASEKTWRILVNFLSASTFLGDNSLYHFYQEALIAESGVLGAHRAGTVMAEQQPYTEGAAETGFSLLDLGVWEVDLRASSLGPSTRHPSPVPLPCLLSSLSPA